MHRWYLDMEQTILFNHRGRKGKFNMVVIFYFLQYFRNITLYEQCWKKSVNACDTSQVANSARPSQAISITSLSQVIHIH